jgi:signal transduction histidine kinase/ligand-binding sensor domain-containing protein/CheY-like chemotaxis protein
VPFKRWVICTARDSTGFLWLGTSHGLYRYDGYTLKNYRHDPNDPGSLSDDTVKAIVRDHLGNLWFGTNFGGVDRLDPVTDRFIHYRHDPRNSGSLGGDAVTFVYEDRAGTLWVAMNNGLDRLDRENGRFIHYHHDPSDPASLTANAINIMNEDREGNFWVGTRWGLNRLDRTTGRVTQFLHDPADPTSLGDDYVEDIEEGRDGVLWVAAGDSLDALDRTSGQFTHYSIHRAGSGANAPRLTSLHEDPMGVLWLGTVKDGILRFDPARKQFSRYTNDPFDPNSLVDDNIHSLFGDPEGMIWACTKAGVSQFSPGPRGFTRYRRRERDPGGLRDNVIWSAREDSRGYLWIGTWNGLHRLDRRTGQTLYYRHDPKDRYSLSSDTVSAIREDPTGNLWLATYGGGLNRLDRSTGRFSAYRAKPGKPGALSSDNLLSLLIDREGYVWTASGDAGLSRLDPKTGRFTTYRNIPDHPNSLSDDNVKVLLEDRQGTLWVGTNGGLNRFDRATGQFKSYRSSPLGGTLSSNIVDSIYEDREGTLWVGCRNGLNRMDRNTGTFTRLSEKDGLPDDTVEAILEDSRGDLWLGTGFGISHFDRRTNTFRNYTEKDGLAGDDTNPYGSEAASLTRSGEMIFGSSKGLTILRPDQLPANQYVPPVVLTDFRLSDKSVQPGKGSPLVRPIWATGALALNDTQNIFSLEFSALSYTAPDSNRYRFRLEPLEHDWNEGNSKRRLATYTNLPPGKYVFRVQGSNDRQVWNEKGARLDITVLPPWWGTAWFQTLAALCLAGLVFAAHRLRMRSLRRTAARLELQVKERTGELEAAKELAESASRAKGGFLAHMSHELRTPLNAIMGFSALAREASRSEEQREHLEVVSRSGEHLLTLINDVLDVAKIEAGKHELTMAACDLTTVVDDICQMMRLRAGQKNLALVCVRPDDFPRFVMADASKLRQVLVNLLGNAVKFTSAGSITLRLSATPGPNGDGNVLLRFEVEDTGIGIPAEDRSRIFEPFVQVTALSQKGTGLGLTITREFVEMMGGTITLDSEPGRGSRFTVEIPAEPAREFELRGTHAVREFRVELDPDQPEYRVLIVEDNADNAMVLERILTQAGYLARTAESGPVGIEAFKKWCPHFIWMDLQLPGISGAETALRIRALPGGRDVKIAAMTASAYASEREQVLAADMDDFIRKPWRPTEIFACMARHLGVRYRSAEKPAETPAAGSELLQPEAIAALPSDLQRDLAEAVTSLNRQRINTVIEGIEEHDERLGRALKRLADRFSYSTILNVIERAKSKAGVDQGTMSNT